MATKNITILDSDLNDIRMAVQAKACGLEPTFEARVAKYEDGRKTVQLVYRAVVLHDIVNPETGEILAPAGKEITRVLWNRRCATPADLKAFENLHIVDATMRFGEFTDDKGNVTVASEPKWVRVYDADGKSYSLNGDPTYVEPKVESVSE